MFADCLVGTRISGHLPLVAHSGKSFKCKKERGQRLPFSAGAERGNPPQTAGYLGKFGVAQIQVKHGGTIMKRLDAVFTRLCSHKVQNAMLLRRWP
jgi:hypothetical protein